MFLQQYIQKYFLFLLYYSNLLNVYITNPAHMLILSIYSNVLFYFKKRCYPPVTSHSVASWFWLSCHYQLEFPLSTAPGQRAEQSSGCVDDIRWRAQIKCRAQSERAWLAVNGEFNHAVISRVQVWLRNAAVTHRLHQEAHQVHHSWAYSPNTHNRTRHMHMPVAFYVPTLLFFFSLLLFSFLNTKVSDLLWFIHAQAGN